MAERPLTRYTKSGDLHIAYQVVGDGPLDLVLVPGFVSHSPRLGKEHPDDQEPVAARPQTAPDA